MNEECIFCKIYRENRDIIIQESKYFYAIFDSFPVTPGHCLIISKRHVPDLFELAEEEWRDLYDFIREIVDIIRKSNLREIYTRMLENPVNERSKRFIERILKNFDLNKEPDGYNIGVNISKAAGQTVFHLHIHIIPRYFGDVPDPTGGVRNVIPEVGNYRK